jgi:SAM-dependent methyltransferase
LGKARLDTQAIGLDTALALSRWLTGTEHLHYGLWTGLDVCAGNVGRAQDAYSAKLFAMLPPRENLRILDIGGGSGETAKKLIAMGHRVEIVVPSAFLATRCRANAPTAVVHECTFQNAAPEGKFDLCLFSESFQYIPVKVALTKACDLLTPEGEILIGDCFRSESFNSVTGAYICGGGHAIGRFRKILGKQPLTILAEEDVTTAVAPSIDVEQGLFNVLGRGLLSTDDELQRKRPFMRWIFMRLLSVFMSTPKRDRLATRLFLQDRNAQVFMANNTYLFMRLGQNGQPKQRT